MKELTSKKTGKVMFVDDDTHKELVRTGAIRKYRVRDMKVLSMRKPELLKPDTLEIKRPVEKPVIHTSKKTKNDRS